MKEERLRILQMLQEGKITVEEADRLLQALVEADGPPGKIVQPASRSRSRFLRVRVFSTNGDKVNVNIPLRLAKFALRFIPKDAQLQMAEQNVDLDTILAAIEEGAEGKIIEVTTDGGDRVEVSVD
ncbi:MAG: SHOCT-like domain-containing protein [Bacteroidota bacterium]